MRKTFKYRIYPSKQQVVQLEWTLEVCRILYNSCLVDRRNHYEQTGKGLTRVRQQEILKAEEAGCWFEKVDPRHTSVECSDCGTKVSKTLATRTHRCPGCGHVLDRDHNAALNILSRAGTARIHACGESSDGGTVRRNRSTSHGSLTQEAPSLAAG